MNPEIKKAWTDALRSGEYEQGQEMLRNGDENGGYSYCCLGVLLDITPDCEFIPEGVAYKPNRPHEWHEESFREDGRAVLEDEEFNFDLRERFDISSELHTELIHMNDNGHSFEEIANVIEARL